MRTARGAHRKWGGAREKPPFPPSPRRAYGDPCVPWGLTGPHRDPLGQWGPIGAVVPHRDPLGPTEAL